MNVIALHTRVYLGGHFKYYSNIYKKRSCHFNKTVATLGLRECEDENSHSQNENLGFHRKRNYRGQNTSHWRVLSIIGKLLKCGCLKWAQMTHFKRRKARSQIGSLTPDHKKLGIDPCV
jgi:hypothetical protein